MSDLYYRELDRLIEEYEEDEKFIRADKMIMLNYPKLFVMSVASSFEHKIKLRLTEFLQYPLGSISVLYPGVHALSQARRNKPMEDKMFAKLEGYESNGIQVLNANNFYDLFDGQPFRDTIKQNYELERSNRICKEGSLISGISALLGQNEQYDRDYAKHSDIKERLEQCTFDKAEQAYLTLKLKRNRVAHDYIHGSSDSFEDVRNFYYDAVLFVIGLEKTLEGLTNQPT